MPLFHQKEEEGMLLGIWKVEEDIETLYSYFANPALYQEEVISFSSQSRIRERLAVRVLLKTLCEEEKQVLYHPSGKPYLQDGSYHISISHTRGYVAIALHTSLEVGIDIEQYGHKVVRVRHKFMHADEEAHVPSVGEISYLLLCWSAKETVYKLLGKDEVEFKEDLIIAPFLLDEKGELMLRELKTKQQQEFVVKYLVHQDFVLTYAHNTSIPLTSVDISPTPGKD